MERAVSEKNYVRLPLRWVIKQFQELNAAISLIDPE
jgi:hypothetical protein